MLEFGRIAACIILFHFFLEEFALIVSSSAVPPAGSVLRGVVRGVQPQKLAEQRVLMGCGGSGEPGADEK